ncbi:MAG: RNA polymerase sigma factor [bacterium]
MINADLEIQLQKHHQAAFGWTLGCCAQDPVEAEDVLQTVYLKILQGRARFDGKAEFKTWLFAVIRNTAADAKRRNVLHFFKLRKYKEHLLESGGSQNPDEKTGQSEIETAFRQILERLPPRQREVLHLVFYHELTLQQASEVMGISIGSARTHYDRGKKRVRALLEKNEVVNESR